MTIGSLFDGSGGFPLAGQICGIDPVWASEIEPYPIAVSHTHFPNMAHLGDVSQVRGGDITPVDVITFGSPCQDLSIAGQQAGIHAGARSSLFFQAVRIIREMREETNGLYPRFAVWENVLGAFQSGGGGDFRCVLTALSGEEIPMPASGKWAQAGCIMGRDYSIAWRVLDAQYWGVPQRRRRIYLVADFAGQCAPKILFERDGLRWHPQTCGETQKTATRDAGTCVTFATREGFASEDIDTMGTLSATDCKSARAVCYALSAVNSNSMKSANPHSGFYEADTSRTLDGNGGNPTCNQGGIAIVESYAIQGSMIGRKEKNGPQGDGINEDVSFTLNTIDRHAVCYHTRECCETDIAHTVDTNGGLKPSCFQGGDVVCYDARGNGGGAIANTVTGGHNSRVNDYMTCIVEPHYVTRRLTPTECARLQGFPDDWAAIKPFDPSETEFWQSVRDTYAECNGKRKRDYTEEQMRCWYEKLHSDSSEYKMWGNGIALPCAVYVMEGIADVLKTKSQ